MGEVRFPNKPESNAFDHVYGENGGKVVRIPASEVGSGYDLIISANEHPHANTNVSNYSVVFGNALDVLEKCENGKIPKVLLVWEYEYDGDDYRNYYEAKSIVSTGGEGAGLQFEFDILEYHTKTSKINIQMSGTADIRNNIISDVWDAEYDAVIDIDCPNNINWMSTEDVSFNPLDILRIWNAINDGKDVKVLIKGKATMDSASEKYPFVLTTTGVHRYGAYLCVSALYPTWNPVAGPISFVFALSNGTWVLDTIDASRFQRN